MHAAMLHHLGAAMNHVIQTMDRWERQGVPPAPPTAQPGFHYSLPLHLVPVGVGLPFPGSTRGRLHAATVSWQDLYLATVHPAPSGREKVSALVSSLSGKALEWDNAVCGEGDAALDHFEDFR